jgi:perosamine synthetase
MFTLKRVWGDHKIYSFQTEKYDFRSFLERIYATKDLEQLHRSSSDFLLFQQNAYQRLENIETDLHKIFYSEIKSREEFKNLYCALVKDLYSFLFPGESCLVYQSFPSIRFQFPRNIAVPPHCDSDELGKHPEGEENFLIPITTMRGSTRLFLESKPGEGDFEGVDLEYGDILYFNGNKCIHYNQSNEEDYMRVSFDFRVIRQERYKNYCKSTITETNPRDLHKERKPVKMLIGGYYQAMFQNRSFERSLQWHSNKELILQTRPSFDATEPQACKAYFENGDPFLTEFKETEKLESQLKEVIGSKHCFMTTSGSSALVVALLALDIQPGDEVIVPNYTMIATANAVRLLGAKPILVDIDPLTFTLNLDILKSALTEKTRAVIHVTLNNRSIGLQDIAAFCKEKALWLIEDAAQSLGCKLNGQHYGTFGDIGCFSLSSPKIITTGQGGFLVTNSDSLGKKIFHIKNFGRSAGGIEKYDMFGLNFKFTDIQAVIGQAQLEKLPFRILKMRWLFETYAKELQDLSTLVKILPAQSKEWIPWFIDIFLQDGETRDALAFFLKQHNIQTRPVYPSISGTEVYGGNTLMTPISASVSHCGLFLPSHLLLTEAQISYICDIIHVFFS